MPSRLDWTDISFFTLHYSTPRKRCHCGTQAAGILRLGFGFYTILKEITTSSSTSELRASDGVRLQ